MNEIISIKNLLCMLLFGISIMCFSQNLSIFKDVEAVKKAIGGDWKLKGEAKNVIYRFGFNEEKGFVEVLEELNLPPKAEKTIGNEIIINQHANVKIKYNEGVYFIELIYDYGSISEQILVLNDYNFIYGKGDSQHVFIKDKN